MELLRTLGALLESPAEGSTHLQALVDVLDLGPLPSAAEHTDLFQFQLYPYASVYLGEEGMLGGEARDRIAGFWRVLDLDPPTECDHLTLMLSYLAELDERQRNAPPEQQARWLHLHTTFLHEHLLTWLGPWLDRLRDVAPPFYRQWADLLEDTLSAVAGEARPTATLPEFMGRTPGLADPRLEGLEAFLDALLAPSRSGLLLLRDDLRRAARQLELGIRLAERKYVLKTLLMQNSAATLAWLSEEARGWASRHRQHHLPSPDVNRHWEQRAAHSARLLKELADERKAQSATAP